ncbi:hypothetical protein GPECTOR_31g391 [Gonium pectorale]|uniref:Uncharacterized protein n=1 Tax=Gonium pectorale TaxID=33097 RepID=A0A150GDV8_GONPE|nr:hypothetical protein GPECTOR_31g391 [Gonium pectorale]|eukprot:KXZ48027.1 hypothetical protein GPECTOR_31g391 [Gonium pectorale]
MIRTPPKVAVLPGSSCVDSFTGLALPFALTAALPANGSVAANASSSSSSSSATGATGAGAGAVGAVLALGTALLHAAASMAAGNNSASAAVANTTATSASLLAPYVAAEAMGHLPPPSPALRPPSPLPPSPPPPSPSPPSPPAGPGATFASSDLVRAALAAAAARARVSVPPGAVNATATVVAGIAAYAEAVKQVALTELGGTRMGLNPLHAAISLSRLAVVQAEAAGKMPSLLSSDPTALSTYVLDALYERLTKAALDLPAVHAALGLLPAPATAPLAASGVAHVVGPLRGCTGQASDLWGAGYQGFTTGTGLGSSSAGSASSGANVGGGRLELASKGLGSVSVAPYGGGCVDGLTGLALNMSVHALGPAATALVVSPVAMLATGIYNLAAVQQLASPSAAHQVAAFAALGLNFTTVTAMLVPSPGSASVSGGSSSSSSSSGSSPVPPSPPAAATASSLDVLPLSHPLLAAVLAANAQLVGLFYSARVLFAPSCYYAYGLGSAETAHELTVTLTTYALAELLLESGGGPLDLSSAAQLNTVFANLAAACTFNSSALKQAVNSSAGVTRPAASGTLFAGGPSSAVGAVLSAANAQLRHIQDLSKTAAVAAAASGGSVPVAYNLTELLVNATQLGYVLQSTLYTRLVTIMSTPYADGLSLVTAMQRLAADFSGTALSQRMREAPVATDAICSAAGALCGSGPSPSPSPSLDSSPAGSGSGGSGGSNTAVIAGAVGGAVGGVALIGLAVAGYFVMKRRQVGLTAIYTFKALNVAGAQGPSPYAETNAAQQGGGGHLDQRASMSTVPAALGYDPTLAQDYPLYPTASATVPYGAGGPTGAHASMAAGPAAFGRGSFAAAGDYQNGGPGGHPNGAAGAGAGAGGGAAYNGHGFNYGYAGHTNGNPAAGPGGGGGGGEYALAAEQYGAPVGHLPPPPLNGHNHHPHQQPAPAAQLVPHQQQQPSYQQLQPPQSLLQHVPAGLPPLYTQRMLHPNAAPSPQSSSPAPPLRPAGPAGPADPTGPPGFRTYPNTAFVSVSHSETIASVPAGHGHSLGPRRSTGHGDSTATREIYNQTLGGSFTSGLAAAAYQHDGGGGSPRVAGISPYNSGGGGGAGPGGYAAAGAHGGVFRTSPSHTAPPTTLSAPSTPVRGGAGGGGGAPNSGGGLNSTLGRRGQLPPLAPYTSVGSPGGGAGSGVAQALHGSMRAIPVNTHFNSSLRPPPGPSSHTAARTVEAGAGAAGTAVLGSGSYAYVGGAAGGAGAGGGLGAASLGSGPAPGPLSMSLRSNLAATGGGPGSSAFVVGSAPERAFAVGRGVAPRSREQGWLG